MGERSHRLTPISVHYSILVQDGGSDKRREVKVSCAVAKYTPFHPPSILNHCQVKREGGSKEFPVHMQWIISPVFVSESGPEMEVEREIG